jgi:hypothetical protein
MLNYFANSEVGKDNTHMGEINQLITEHGSSTVLRERLMLLSDQLDQLQNENVRLENLNQSLLSENDGLKKQLHQQSATERYVKLRGMLWLVEDDHFESNPYCPNCKEVMGEFPPQTNWVCSVCTRIFDFCRTPALPSASS